MHDANGYRQAFPNAQTIHRVQLANGIVVLAYHNPHVQSVNVVGSFYGGSIYERPEQGGLASMTASALMRGTQTRDFDGVYGTLEAMGADLSVSSGRMTVSFSGRALAEDLPHVLAILADVLRHPVFPDDEIAQMRAQRITGLKYSQQDIRYRAKRAFSQALYAPDHPFHHSASGTLETVPGLQPEHLRDFHAAHYGPEQMIIVVVGALPPEQAVQMVRDQLEDWQNPQQPAPPDLPPAPPPDEMRRTYIDLAGKTQAAIVMGSVGPSALAEDYQAARLVNSVLGEFGMMGRIGHTIREREGLAYYAYSRVDGGLGPGAWRIAAGVAPEDVDRAIALARDEIRRIVTEPISEDDLADNQSYFTGRLPLQLETSAGVANQILLMARYGRGLDYLDRYHDAIYRLTRDDLLKAAQHYLDPDRLVIAVAGPPR